MTIDMAKIYKTRNGYPVRLLADNLRGEYPLVGVVHLEDVDLVDTWTKDGCLISPSQTNPHDLIEVKLEETEMTDKTDTTDKTEKSAAVRNAVPQINFVGALANLPLNTMLPLINTLLQNITTRDLVEGCLRHNIEPDMNFVEQMQKREAETPVDETQNENG